MPHTRKHARRLLSELIPHLPEAAARVLESPSYWDPGFCKLLFEHTEMLTFSEPQVGLQVARMLPRLAQAIPDGQTPEERREHRERRVKAHALLGEALRVTGCLQAARRQFRAALRLCRNAAISSAAHADLLWRLAILRVYERDFEEALRIVDEAEKRFRAEGDREGIGLSVATKGTVFVAARRFPEAVTTLSELLASHKLLPRAQHSATHNLAYAVSQARELNLEAALGYLHRARQILGPRRSVQKARLYWIEGMIFLRCGSAYAERGERRYMKALQGFLKFQTPYEIALVSLDLSALYRFQNRWPELEELAADTYHRFRELQEDTEALTALKLWSDAARMRTLSDEAISDVKAKLEKRARRHPAIAAPRRGR